MSEEATVETQMDSIRWGLIRKLSYIVVMVVLTIVLMCLSVSVGAAESVTPEVSFKVMVNQILPGTFDVPDNLTRIVTNLRMPRILMGICAGVILALGGCIMQTLMNNPLATPYTLGVSSASAFGACLAIAFGVSLAGSTAAVATNAFLFSLIPLAVITVCGRFKCLTPVTIVLMGVATSYVFSAGLTLMEYFMDQETLSSIVFWTVGDLSYAFGWEIPYAAVTAMALLIFTLLMSKQMNIMRMGDDTAKSLGINVDLVRLLCIIASCLCTAIVICFIGTIGFVCLLAPQISRYVVGGNVRYLAIASAATGAALMLIADILSKSLISPGLLPVGAITALIGGPVLIILLMKSRSSTVRFPVGSPCMDIAPA